MPAVQVVNTGSNVLWTTDKVEIATTLATVNFQVVQTQTQYIQANGVPTNAAMSISTGNLYANAIALPGNSTQEYYVGAGNYLNILTGATGFTAVAIGSATSATAGVTGA
jgi:hypothetical protein